MLNIPDKYKYEAMVHKLGKCYGISPREAEKLTELDYFIMVGNENQESEITEYISKNHND